MESYSDTMNAIVRMANSKPTSDDEIIAFIKSKGFNPDDFKDNSPILASIKKDKKVQKLEKTFRYYNEGGLLGKVSDVPYVGGVAKAAKATGDLVGKMIPGKSGLEESESSLKRRIDQIASGASKGDVFKEELTSAGKDVLDTVVDAAMLMSPGKLANIPGVKQLGARVAKKVPGIVKSLGKTADVAVTEGLLAGSGNLIKEFTETEDLNKSFKSAKEAGLSTGAVISAMALAGKGAQGLALLGRISGKPVGAIMEQVTQIPKEWYKKFLDAEMAGTPLKPLSKKEIKSTGDKVKSAMDDLEVRDKALADKEVKILENKPPMTEESNIILSNIESSIKGIVSPKLRDKPVQELLALAKNGELKISQGTLKAKEAEHLLDAIEAISDGNIDPTDLVFIKRNLDDEAWALSKDNVGTSQMKKLSKSIGDALKIKHDSYRVFSDKYSEMMDLAKASKNMLKEFSVEKTVKDFGEGKMIQAKVDVLKRIDELAPDELKFIAEIEGGTIANAFNRVFPGKNYLGDSGGQIRQTLFGGAAVLGSLATGARRGVGAGAATFLGTAAATSPIINKAAMKAGVGVVKGVRAAQPAIKGISRLGAREEWTQERAQDEWAKLRGR